MPRPKPTRSGSSADTPGRGKRPPWPWYRLERTAAALAGSQPSQAEWRRIWQAYRARRPARVPAAM